MSIYHTYDVRGLYPSEITTSVAEKVAKACLKIFNSGSVVVGYDGRHGSKELAQTLKDTLESGSREVHFVGYSSTPMFAFLINNLKAAGGIMVTASHNPPQYNGFKVLGEGAVSIKGTDVEKYIN